MPAITSTSNQNFVKQKQITNGSPDDVVFLANHTMKTDTVTPNKRQGPILQTKPVVKSLEQVQIKNMPQNMMGPILQKQQPQNFQDSIDVQANGQRIYGPPANWSGPPPPKGSEVFVGKVPRDCSEQELMPIFEKMGKIYELRIMMNFTGANRGFLFVRYTNKEDAKRAVKELNNYEIRPNKFLGVTHSVDNRKLWISGLPKNSSASDIKADMERLTEGVCDVILYTSQMDKSRTRGYAFVEYESHRAAALARRKLNLGRVYLLGQELDKVDWAEPENEVDEDVMKTVRVLFLRNLMPITTEEKICSTMSELAGSIDCVERTKKLKDYAFVHFISRESAEKAFRSSQNLMIDGSSIEVSWSKPVDKQVYNMRKQLTKFLSSSPQRPTEASILPLPNLPPFVYPPVPPRSPRRRGAAGIKGLGAPGSVPLRGLVRKYASASSGFDSNHNSKLMGPLLTPMFSNPPFLPEYFTNDLHKTWAEASQQVVSECDEGNFGRQFFQSGFHSHHPLTIATMFAAMNPAGYFPNILPHAPPLTMFPQQGSGVAGVQSPSGSYADLQELHQLSASIMNMNL